MRAMQRHAILRTSFCWNTRTLHISAAATARRPALCGILIGVVSPGLGAKRALQDFLGHDRRCGFDLATRP